MCVCVCVLYVCVAVRMYVVGGGCPRRRRRRWGWCSRGKGGGPAAHAAARAAGRRRPGGCRRAAAAATPGLAPTAGCRRRRKLGPAVGRLLPPVLILHGTADKSVPMEVAVEFVAALKVGSGLRWAASCVCLLPPSACGWGGARAVERCGRVPGGRQAMRRPLLSGLRRVPGAACCHCFCTASRSRV